MNPTDEPPLSDLHDDADVRPARAEHGLGLFMPLPLPRAWVPWLRRLLGDDPVQRRRSSQSLLALVGYGLLALCQAVEVKWGLIDDTESDRLMAVALGGALLFFLLVRSGVSLRWRDPSLTLPQIAFALAMATWTYAITGPARGVLLALAMLALLFGMFKLSVRQSTGLALASFTSLAGVMVWRSQTLPEVYDPRVEAVHMAFSLVILAGVTVLLVSMARLRRRLTDQRSELREALERIRLLATRDELTGLPNRRALLAALSVESSRQARTGTPLALVLIDIDFFKHINDRHGHPTGDAVLQRFAERLSSDLRAADMMARWGGEEFLLMLPDTSLDDALCCMRRMRDNLRRTPLLDGTPPHPPLQPTFSAGVSLCRGPVDAERAIDRADQALYRAKAAGRDRIEAAD
jgi:diguanylate cyclase